MELNKKRHFITFTTWIFCKVKAKYCVTEISLEEFLRLYFELGFFGQYLEVLLVPVDH